MLQSFLGVFQYSRNTWWYNTGTYYVESMCFQSDRFHFRYLLTWCGSKLYSNAALLDLVYQTLEKLMYLFRRLFFNRTLSVLIIRNLKTICPLHSKAELAAWKKNGNFTFLSTSHSIPLYYNFKLGNLWSKKYSTILRNLGKNWCLQPRTTDTQRESFFKNPKHLDLGRHFGLKYFEAFGVFSDPFWYWVPCPCFP